MKKFLISAAALGVSIAVAAPAAAQGYYPPVPQGQAYGYDNYGQVRRLEARVQQIRHQIRQLDRRNILSNREARSLDRQAMELQRRISRLGWNGVNWMERRDIEARTYQLERRVQREARDRDFRSGSQYGQNWNDRDRDGRNDRYEDDRGTRHD